MRLPENEIRNESNSETSGAHFHSGHQDMPGHASGMDVEGPGMTTGAANVFAEPSPGRQNTAHQPFSGHGVAQAGGDQTEESVLITIGTPLEAAERRIICATLNKYRGNKRMTAEVLGISLKTLYNRLTAYQRSNNGSGQQNNP